MPNRISRRDLGVKAALGFGSIALASTASAQNAMDTPPPVPDSALDNIEGQLAKPLSPEAKKLLKDAVTNSRSSSKARLKTKLIENSEPCFATLTHPAETVTA